MSRQPVGHVQQLLSIDCAGCRQTTHMLTLARQSTRGLDTVCIHSRSRTDGDMRQIQHRNIDCHMMRQPQSAISCTPVCSALDRTHNMAE